MRALGAATLLLCSACIVGEDSEPVKTATANVMPTTGNTATGSAKFTLADSKVSAMVTLANAPEGVHGFHIHQMPACGNDGMDAGGHWDGADVAGGTDTHGLPGGATMHLGDLGNITIAADGTGTLTASNPNWRLGDGSLFDVVNHAVIFHANMDDGTMASAGARMG